MKSLASILSAQPERRLIGGDIDEDGVRQLLSSGQVSGVLDWSRLTKAQLVEFRPDVVVVSLAVPANLPGLNWLRECGVRIWSLPEALGAALSGTRQLCVAGTHGKSTTTAMLWWILQGAGRRPIRFLGADLCAAPSGATPSENALAVVESCEYRDSFLHLSPSTLVLTGIEPDHFDWFESIRAAERSYGQMMRKLPSTGHLVVNADCDTAFGLSGSISGGQVIRYAYHRSGREADWFWDATPSAPNGLVSSGFWPQEFRLLNSRESGRAGISVRLQVPGLHNCRNAVGAILAAGTVGVSLDEAAERLADFPGIRRRFEFRGQWRGVTLIDDFAHHPSAVKATIRTAQSVFPGRRIVAIFEPHQYSRTQHLFAEFTESLSLAEETLILPVLPAREDVSAAMCRRASGELVRSVNQRNGRAFLMSNLDQVLGRLDHSARPGDVVITLGAGRTNTIHDEIHRRLQRDFAA